MTFPRRKSTKTEEPGINPALLIYSCISLKILRCWEYAGTE